MGEPLTLDPHCGNAACPVGDAWSLAVQDGRLVDVSASAQTVGFIVPVALSAPLWADLKTVPRGTEGVGFPYSLETLLSQAFQIIQFTQTAAATFSFRLPHPHHPPDDLAVLITTGVKKKGHPGPVSLFRCGEPPWFIPAEDACSSCAEPETAQGFRPTPLRHTIRSHPLI